MDRVLMALFAGALRLNPPGFRREYGSAMRNDYLNAFTEARTLHGTSGALSCALGAVADILITAAREYTAMLFRDFSYAFRSLAKTPSFAAIVVATFALAIGANASVFSILNGVVFAPLPYRDPGRLVQLDEGNGPLSARSHTLSFSLPDYADLTRPNGALFVSTAAFAFDGSKTLTGHGEPRKLTSVVTTSGFFTTLGTVAEAGRFPEPRDAARESSPTVVLSDALWRSEFDADPRVVGSVQIFDGKSYRVIGICPAGFQQPYMHRGFIPIDVWTFLPDDGAGTRYTRGWHTFSVVARLAPGVEIRAVDAALNRVAAELARRNPADDGQLSSNALPLADSLLGSARPLMLALFGAVCAVLLVACANVANLLLSRAASRDRELSVRIAIGASRGRIVMQLLVEAFVLASIGGLIGLGIAGGVVAAFRAVHPPAIPRPEAVTVDGAALLYTFGVVAFCTVVAGLAPAIASAHGDIASALKNAGRGGDGSRGHRARSVLAIAEIAMTLSLVVAAGLVLRSYVALTGQPLGFDPANLALVGVVELPDSRYATDAAVDQFMTRALDRVRALPGVRSASWAYVAPFGGNRFGSTFVIRGRAYKPGTEPDSTLNPIGVDYFRTTGARLVAGRAFTEDDRMGTRPVAIVNQAFARAFFPGRSPIGEEIVPSIFSGTGRPPARTIVGVSADVRLSFTSSPEPAIELPMHQFPISGAYLMISHDPGVDPTSATVKILASLDPLLPAPEISRVTGLLARSVATQRLTVFALCALAFVALALSVAGVFAIVSYGVTQRTHEFGVRMALGADSTQIVRMVLGGALRLAAIGIVAGLLIAGAGTRFLADQLYDTQPLDPATYAVVAVVVLAAAGVAAFVPARRATRVDPIVALRYE